MGLLSWLPPLVRFRPDGPHHVSVRDLTYLHQDQELHPHKHLSARIYYPSASAPSFLSWSRWPAMWLPSSMYARGYAEALVPPNYHKGWKMTLLRVVLTVLIFALGNTAAIPAAHGAPLIPQGKSEEEEERTGEGEAKEEQRRGDAAHKRMPVVLISHGYCGNRSIHSSLACELASRGYVVVAVEHADGSSSLTRLAPGIKPESLLSRRVAGTRWLLNGGWGPWEDQLERTRWRVKELVTAHALLSAMNQGLHVEGLHVTGLSPGTPGVPISGASVGIDHPCVGACLSAPKRPPAADAHGDAKARKQRDSSRPDVASFLAGRLDMGRVAVAGHSWGGATAALAVSEHKEFVAGVALDPWWKVLPPECNALNGRWGTRSPLLVLGSHEWNGTPDAKGELHCGKAQRDKALAAAAAGGGALLLVPEGSTHHSFDDVLLFFQDLVQPILTMFGFHSRLHPRRATDLVQQSMLHFLDTHVNRAQQRVPSQLPSIASQAASEEGQQQRYQRPVLPLPFAASHLKPYLDICGPDLNSHALTVAGAEAGSVVSLKEAVLA